MTSFRLLMTKPLSKMSSKLLKTSLKVLKLMHCNKKVINLAAWVYHQDRMLSSESPCCCLSAFSSLPSNGELGREKYIHFPKWCRPGSHLPMSISDCRGPFNWTKCVKHLCFSKCALKNILRIKERAQSLTHWPFGKTNQLKIHCKLRIETQLPEYRVPLHVYCFIASQDKPFVNSAPWSSSSHSSWRTHSFGYVEAGLSDALGTVVPGRTELSLWRGVKARIEKEEWDSKAVHRIVWAY